MNNIELGSMQIRAICTDVDGTLLDSRRQLSVKTIASIKRIRDKMPVILASSRMPSAMVHLQAELGILRHPLICYNGGYIIHHAEHTSSPIVIHSVQIPVSICASILMLVNGTSIHVSLYAEDEWYAPGTDEWTLRESTITKVNPILKNGEEVLAMWESKDSGAHKVMCMGVAEEISVLEATLRTRFADQIHVYHSKSTYLEMAPKAVSKASALKLLLTQLYNFDLSQVMAFGDNYNDIELLRSVGFGIAVANAREEVKAVSKELTTTSKEDGVAMAINKYIP